MAGSPAVPEAGKKLEQEAPSSDKMPWEEVWGTPPQPQTQASPQAQKMPWEDVWGGRVIDNIRQKLQTSFQFEQVYDKLLMAESRNRHRNADGSLVTSPVGAQGVSQVMPKTGRDPGYGVRPIQNDSEEEFRRFGRDYLQAMVREFDGDFEKAVAAYNAGPGSVQNAVKRANRSGGSWTQYLPKKSETLPYMERILGRSYAS